MGTYSNSSDGKQYAIQLKAEPKKNPIFLHDG